MFSNSPDESSSDLEIVYDQGTNEEDAGSPRSVGSAGEVETLSEKLMKEQFYSIDYLLQGNIDTPKSPVTNAQELSPGIVAAVSSESHHQIWPQENTIRNSECPYDPQSKSYLKNDFHNKFQQPSSDSNIIYEDVNEISDVEVVKPSKARVTNLPHTDAKINIHSCAICGKEFKSRRGLGIHKSWAHSHQDNPLESNQLENSLIKIGNVRSLLDASPTVTEVKTIWKKQRRKRKPGDCSGIYKCIYCCLLIDRFDNLVCHIFMSHPEAIRCLLCNLYFLSQQELDAHKCPGQPDLFELDREVFPLKKYQTEEKTIEKCEDTMLKNSKCNYCEIQKGALVTNFNNYYSEFSHCSICHRTFFKKASLKKHFLRGCVAGPECGSKSDLVKPIEGITRRVANQRKIRTTRIFENDLHECHYCELFFKEKFRLGRHFARFHPDLSWCNRCFNVFAGKEFLETHLAMENMCQKIHSYIKKIVERVKIDCKKNPLLRTKGCRAFKCFTCKMIFTSKYKQVEHRVKFHPEAFKCPLCSIHFYNKNILLYHRSTGPCKDPKKARCSVKFKSKPSSLIVYKCTYCNALIAGSHYLGVHTKIMHPKAQRCKECNALLLHSEWKSHICPKKCEYCEKKFNSSNMYNIHLQSVHANELKVNASCNTAFPISDIDTQSCQPKETPNSSSILQDMLSSCSSAHTSCVKTSEVTAHTSKQNCADCGDSCRCATVLMLQKCTKEVQVPPKSTEVARVNESIENLYAKFGIKMEDE